MVMESLGLEQEISTKFGGLISSREFANRLGLRSFETVRNYYRKGRIIGLSQGGRNLRFPAWQIHRQALLPGLSEIIKILSEKGMDSLSQIIFFVYECDELSGKIPLTILRAGKLEKVVSSACKQQVMGR